MLINYYFFSFIAADFLESRIECALEYEYSDWIKAIGQSEKVFLICTNIFTIPNYERFLSFAQTSRGLFSVKLNSQTTQQPSFNYHNKVGSLLHESVVAQSDSVIDRATIATAVAHDYYYFYKKHKHCINNDRKIIKMNLYDFSGIWSMEN